HAAGHVALVPVETIVVEFRHGAHHASRSLPMLRSLHRCAATPSCIGLGKIAAVPGEFSRLWPNPPDITPGAMSVRRRGEHPLEMSECFVARERLLGAEPSG